jgi:hypothetical protein
LKTNPLEVVRLQKATNVFLANGLQFEIEKGGGVTVPGTRFLPVYPGKTNWPGRLCAD